MITHVHAMCVCVFGFFFIFSLYLSHLKLLKTRIRFYLNAHHRTCDGIHLSMIHFKHYIFHEYFQQNQVRHYVKAIRMRYTIHPSIHRQTNIVIVILDWWIEHISSPSPVNTVHKLHTSWLMILLINTLPVYWNYFWKKFMQFKG